MSILTSSMSILKSLSTYYWCWHKPHGLSSWRCFVAQLNWKSFNLSDQCSSYNELLFCLFQASQRQMVFEGNARRSVLVHTRTHTCPRMHAHNDSHTHTQRLLAPSSKLVPLVVFSVSAKGGEGRGGKKTERMKFLFSNKEHIRWTSSDSIDWSFWRPRIVVVEWLATMGEISRGG